MLGKIVNKFRIDGVSGEGGMGIVYRAWDMVLERPVALKMIHREHSPNETSFRRFLGEAKILAKLEHPNIVLVHDLLEHEGIWFIVMQYVEGMTLAQTIEREGPMPYRRISTISKQILSALGYAHRAGVIHRDIKPGNVILTLEGTIKVTDFGLAKYEHSPALTQTTSTGGTLYYMSPEQVRNLADVDHRSDLYATGMTLYEMLTGRTPFPPGSPPIDIMNAILQQNFPSPSSLFAPVPEHLSRIVMKALAKAPAQRYQSADEMLNALKQFEYRIALAKTERLPKEVDFDAFSLQTAGEGSEDLAPKPGAKELPVPDASQPGKFKSLVFGFLLVAAVVLVAWFAIGVWQRSSRTPERPPQKPVPLALARLSLLTEPANATVFLNGDSIGLTPIQSYASKAGTLALRIQMQDFSPIDTFTTVAAGKDTTLSFRLLALNLPAPETLTAASDTLRPASSQAPSTTPAVGAVRIDSKPRGATVIFAGKTRGKTPQTVTNVPVGEHGIVLKKTDYRDASLSVTIASGKTEDIEATLSPLMGRLRVLVKPSGAIYVEGVQERPDASDPYETTLPVGAYRIKAASPEHGVLERTMRIEADRLQEWTVDFNKMVTLIVTAFDPGGQRVLGEVFVDEKQIGQTLQELRVRVGQRKIEVRREGYRLAGNPQNLTLEENIEQPVRLRFTLQK